MPKWLFQFNYEEDSSGLTQLIIVNRELFAQEQCLSDEHITNEIGSDLPDIFYEEAESFFTTKATIDEARAALLATGAFEEQKLF